MDDPDAPFGNWNHWLLYDIPVSLQGAHPDDENTAVIAYFARGRHMRTAYLSATRGEGGQNLIGAEQAELMGLIRTQELLAARRIDGGEQFFTRAIDFGFSKNPEEALGKWGREQVLSDMVRIIRRFQPDVIVSRFSPVLSGGHGQHTAIGKLSIVAFEAAGDPIQFPGQIHQGLKPWKAKRLYCNIPTFTRRMMEAAAARKDRLRINVGQYDPVLGKSYAEIAGESRSLHQSQAMGASQRKGNAPAFFAHIAGEPAQKDLFEGIDTSWGRVPGAAAVSRLLMKAREEYRPGHPEAILPLLIDAYAELEDLSGYWPEVKRPRLLKAIELAAGLWIDATADRWNATPGSDVDLSLSVVNRSPHRFTWTRTEVAGVASGGNSEAAELAHNEPAEKKCGLPFRTSPSTPSPSGCGVPPTARSTTFMTRASSACRKLRRFSKRRSISEPARASSCRSAVRWSIAGSTARGASDPVTCKLCPPSRSPSCRRI